MHRDFMGYLCKTPFSLDTKCPSTALPLTADGHSHGPAMLFHAWAKPLSCGANNVI